MSAPRIRISSKPISVDHALKSVATRKAGGTVLFLGSVRESSGRMKLTHMKLEAAEDLAKADLEKILTRATRKFDILKIAVEHRIGKLKVGDLILVVAVSASHRRDAFAACKFIIDELKKTTPIWKKEFGRGMERWVRSES